ncbi:MAG: RNA polymerase subunit sigma-24 [Chloroflexi bacterium HGW-Chloroflexi-4]|jgi:RNA polymerase sigma-70 factor (ECF subfamily)|nr:MAG: RNA polymerase subunit sigma-24 [Chloroflexi bacterium HGW-Chloroflexi-4]
MINNEQSEFIEALIHGDRQAFAKLVDETSTQIYRTARQILGDEQDAEDVLQETYMKALKALPTFEGRSSVSTWLHRIAVNEALMLIRKRKAPMVSVDDNQPFDSDEESNGMEIVDFCCLPEKELLSAESRKFMDQAIQRLPETLKTVFVLRDLEGLSILETAELMQITENNVKTRLLRARLRLRQELATYYAEKVEKERSK